MLVCLNNIWLSTIYSSLVEWHRFEFAYAYMYVADRSVFTDKDIEFLKKECQELDNLLIPAFEVKLMTVLGEGMYIQLKIIVFTIYYSNKWIYLGEFGKVYKGVWQHKSDFGDAVSQVVAVKTIKSNYTCKCEWACENRPYLQKIHMFRKWYCSWSVFKINKFCKLNLLSRSFNNVA